MNFLGRARKMLQGMAPAEPPRPQPYAVACPEGHILRGHRTEGYQAVRCPACGEGIFVLPRSPLPDPPAPPSDRARKRAVAPVGSGSWDDAPIALSEAPPQVEPEAEAEAEIEWLDPGPGAVSTGPQPDGGPEIDYEDESPPTRPRPPDRPVPNAPDGRPRPAAARPVGEAGEPPQSARKPAVRPRRSQPQAASSGPASPAGPTIALPARPGLVERVRRRPLPWTLAAVGLIVVGTVAWKLHREHRQRLPGIAETNRTEGMQALEEGRFGVAKEKLAIAARALEELGDEQAGKVRQSADEAAILADLVPSPLEDLIDVAAFKTDEWPSIFRAKYQGRSIVVSGELGTTEGPDGGLGVERLIVGEGLRPNLGRLDYAGFPLFRSGGFKPGQPVTFGARLAGFRLGERGEWVVTLEPDSGVIMTDHKALAAQPGWDDAEVSR